MTSVILPTGTARSTACRISPDVSSGSTYRSIPAPAARRRRVGAAVPERRGEPDGKPEAVVVTDDGTFLVGLDTETPHANLCWYRP